MEKSATRQNLLRLKGAEEAARRGKELLRNKRFALMREFLGLADECAGCRDEIALVLRKARLDLELTKALAPEAILPFAKKSSREVSLDIKVRNVWGVNVPEIETVAVVRTVEARSVSPLGESAGTLDTAKGFEVIVEKAIGLASRQSRFERIGEAIRSDTRKINALEEVVLKRISSMIKTTERVLAEREKEDIYRMKRHKTKRDGRKR
ncbi:MAG: V-type ATP synthase subunit D [Deltaproteobacteria bacterium]|nr:V-type ATP synthase subunit D [Deltaproteobacteria bacterium]